MSHPHTCPPAEPWLPLAEDYRERNAAAQQENPHSLLCFTMRLLQLRRSSLALQLGRYRSVSSPSGSFAYLRESEHERLLVLLNFTGGKIRSDLPSTGELLLSSEPGRDTAEGDSCNLAPNEAAVVRL